MSNTTILQKAKQQTVQSCEVYSANVLLSKLLAVLGTTYEDMVLEVDHSRVNHECSKISYTDNLGRDVQTKIVIRKSLVGGHQRSGVLHPMTYVEYNDFSKVVTEMLHDEVKTEYGEFMAGLVSINKTDYIFECDQDIVGGDGYFSLVVENKARSFMVNVEIEITES